MSEECHHRSLTLIPDASISDAPTGARRIMSMMVGEVLTVALQEQAAEPCLRILFGETGKTFPGWDTAYEKMFRSRLKDRRNIKLVQCSPFAPDLISAAWEQPFTLSILILNNIILPCEVMSPATVLDKKLEFLGMMKAAFKRPIIVLDGHYWSDTEDMPQRVKLAGGDAYLKLPPDTDSLLQAVESCLSYPERPASNEIAPIRVWLKSFFVSGE